MTPAVTFDYATWVARYPEFKDLPLPLAQAYFDETNLYWQNNATNPSFANGTLSTLLNMLTAHLAQLNQAAPGGQQQSQLVGRISSASQGSESVSAEYDKSGTPSEAFFTQTKYGAAFWQATAQYRTARYRARPTVVYGGAYPLIYSRPR